MPPHDLSQFLHEAEVLLSQCSLAELKLLRRALWHYRGAASPELPQFLDRHRQARAVNRIMEVVAELESSRRSQRLTDMEPYRQHRRVSYAHL
ncbi:MAG: hypothetical protein HC919_08040 [Oscillatoriales cyanobacterium SM2_2_1]|nr:hypothetical protein [Oscillatoriales cyanobacterium SM2_2_1]